MSDSKVSQRNFVEPMLSSYLNRKACALGVPVSGNFELTSRCNFDCKMCYVHSLKNQSSLIERELTADQWLGIASDARDAGMIFLLLTGGEPFLRKDFAKIYEELVKMGIIVSINTNASLYNEEIRDSFLKYPPTRINVTLYGGSEETYQSLCGNASFEKVRSNLRSMKKDSLPVRLNISLTPYNVADMAKIDEVSREIGLQAKASSYMYPPVRVDGTIGDNQARFEAEEAGKIMARWDYMRESEEQFQIRCEKMMLPEYEEETDSNVKREGVTCRAGRSSFWITWEGDMMPCGTMNADAINVLANGFNKAWEGINQLTREIYLPKECTLCPMRKNCSVCVSICKCETGDFEKKPEYLCRLTQARYDETFRLAELRKRGIKIEN